MALSAGPHARPLASRPGYTPPAKCFRCLQAASRRTGSTAPGNQRGNVRVQVGRNLGTQVIGGGLGGSNEIFVAGVGDEEQAQSVVDFATSVELLKKQEAQKLRLTELDLADPDGVALPKRGRIVVVITDTASKGALKIDAKAASKILQAAQENEAQQFVLVTPAGSSGGGGFFGNLFGGSSAAGGSGKKPSKVEQELASSGLDFVVVRTGKTDVSGSEFESSNNVALGPQGSLPQRSSISKSQVAEVVQQILRQADTDILIEAWAGPQEPQLNIEELVAQALPAAKIEEEELEVEEDSPIQAVQEVAQEADVPEEVEKPARSFFGGFGTSKIKKQQDSDVSEEASPIPKPTPAPKRRPTPPSPKRTPAAAKKDSSDEDIGTQRVGLFGFGKKSKPEEEEESAKPQKGFLGFGGGKKQEEEEPEEPASSSPLKNLFGAKKKEQADVSPEGARSSAARGVKAVGKAAKRPNPPAPSRRGAQKQEAKPQKKGFLSSIGFDTDKYSYEEDD